MSKKPYELQPGDKNPKILSKGANKLTLNGAGKRAYIKATNKYVVEVKVIENATGGVAYNPSLMNYIDNRVSANLVVMKSDRQLQAEEAFLAKDRNLSAPIQPDDEVTYKGIKMPAGMAFKWIEKAQEKASMVPISNEKLAERNAARKLRKANLLGLLMHEQGLERGEESHKKQILDLFLVIGEMTDYEVAQNLKMHEQEIYEWKNVDPVRATKNLQDSTTEEDIVRRILTGSDEEIDRWEVILGSTRSESMMDVISDLKPETILSGKFAAAGLMDSAKSYIGRYKAWLAGQLPDIKHEDYKLFESIRLSKLNTGMLVSGDSEYVEYAETQGMLDEPDPLDDEQQKMVAAGNTEGVVRSILGNYLQGYFGKESDNWRTDILPRRGVQDSSGILGEYMLQPSRDLSEQERYIIEQAEAPYSLRFGSDILEIDPNPRRSRGIAAADPSIAQQLNANKEAAKARLAAQGRPVVEEEEEEFISQGDAHLKSFAYAGVMLGQEDPQSYFNAMAELYLNPDYSGTDRDKIKEQIANELSKTVPDRFEQINRNNIEAGAKLEQEMKNHILYGFPVVKPDMQSYASAFPMPGEFSDKFGVAVKPNLTSSGRRADFYPGREDVVASLLETNTIQYSVKNVDEFRGEDFDKAARIIGFRNAASGAAQTFFRKGGQSYKESVQGKGFQTPWRQYGENFDVVADDLSLDTEEGLDHFISVLDQVIEANDYQALKDIRNTDLDGDPTVRAVSGYIRDLLSLHLPVSDIGFEPDRLENSKSVLNELRDRLDADRKEKEYDTPILPTSTGVVKRYEDLVALAAYTKNEYEEFLKGVDEYRDEETLLESMESAREKLQHFINEEGVHVSSVAEDKKLLNKLGIDVPDYIEEEEENGGQDEEGDISSEFDADAASGAGTAFDNRSLTEIKEGVTEVFDSGGAAPDVGRDASGDKTKDAAPRSDRNPIVGPGATNVGVNATSALTYDTQRFKTREQFEAHAQDSYFKQFPNMIRGPEAKSVPWYREKITNISSSVLNTVLGKKFNLKDFTLNRKIESEIYQGGTRPWEGNIHTKRGNAMEELAAREWEKNNPGRFLASMPSMKDSNNPLLGSTSLDRIVVDAEGNFLGEAVELKAPNTLHENQRGEDQIKEHQNQAQGQMAVASGVERVNLVQARFGDEGDSRKLNLVSTPMDKSKTWQNTNVPIMMATQTAINEELNQGMTPFNTFGKFQFAGTDSQKTPYIFSEEFTLAQKERDKATIKKLTLGSGAAGDSGSSSTSKPKSKTQIENEASAERGRIRREAADKKREAADAKREAKAAEKEQYDNSITGKLGNAKGAFLKKFAGPLAIAGLIKDGVDFIAEGAEGANNFIGKAYDMGMKPADMTEKIIGMSGQGMTLGQTHTVLGQTQLMAGGMEVGMFDGAKRLVIATRGALTFEDIQKYGNDPQKLMELLRQRTGNQYSERALMAMLAGGGVDTSLLRVGDHGPEQSYLALTNSAKTFGNVSNALGATTALVGGSAASMTEALESLNNFQEPKTEEQKAATREQQHAGRGGAPNRPHFGPSGNKGGAENVHVTVHLKQDGSTNLKAQRGNQNVEGKIGGRAQGMGITK